MLLVISPQSKINFRGESDAEKKNVLPLLQLRVPLLHESQEAIRAERTHSHSDGVRVGPFDASSTQRGNELENNANDI